MKFGTLEGVKEDISQFREMLKTLGDSGTFTLDTAAKKSDLKISDSVSLKVQTPFIFDYHFEDDSLVIEFRKPYPVGTFKILSKYVSSVTVSLDRIEIELEWAPDGYLEIRS